MRRWASRGGGELPFLFLPPPRAPPFPSSASALLELPLHAGANSLCGMQQGKLVTAGGASPKSPLSFAQQPVFADGHQEAARDSLTNQATC